MILFTFPKYKSIVKFLHRMANLRSGNFLVQRFPNQEMYIALSTKVRDKDCLILGSISPPDEQLLELSLLAHTLKKEGARMVTALLPYLAYSRQDKDKKGESMAISLIGGVLDTSGIDEVITIDVHSPKVAQILPFPLEALTPAYIFAREIKKLSLLDATIVAPDEGAISRVRDVAEAAGIQEPIVYLRKERTKKGVEHLSLQGNVGQKVVVVDDILDTGSTLISACEKLQSQGVKEIVIMVTHGLFTGNAWQKLWSLGVKKIYTTDSIPKTREFASARIKILSIKPLLKEYIESIKEKPSSRIKEYESLIYEG